MATPITYTISFMNNIQKSILLIYPNYRRKKAADGRTWNIISISSDDRYLVNVHGRIEPFGGLLLGPGVTFMECKKSPAQLMGGHFCHHHFGNIIRRCTESSTLPTFSFCKPGFLKALFSGLPPAAIGPQRLKITKIISFQYSRILFNLFESHISSNVYLNFRAKNSLLDDFQTLWRLSIFICNDKLFIRVALLLLAPLQ